MPKIVDKELKKLDILHAAMRVFARQGIVKAKVIDIAQEAGVGKGTIYEYFRSKDDIFKTAFLYQFKSTEEKVLHAISPISDPVKKIRLMILTSLDSFMHGDGEFAEIMMDFWAEGVRNKNNDVMDIIDLKTIYREYRRLLSDILQDGIAKGYFREMDVNATASALIGALDGLLLQWIVDRTAVDIRKVSGALLDGFLNGLKNK